MRFIGLMLAGLMVAQNAMAAETCVRPADRAAFAAEGLKSELMVTALSCNAQPQYNAFITRYRGDLGAEEKALGAYFARTYGRGAQKAHDDYITNLANVQSGDGLKAGTLFCARNVAMFHEVEALKSGAEIPDYVAGKDILQPETLTDCTTAEPATRRGVHEVRSRSRAPAHHTAAKTRKS